MTKIKTEKQENDNITPLQEAIDQTLLYLKSLLNMQDFEENPKAMSMAEDQSKNFNKLVTSLCKLEKIEAEKMPESLTKTLFDQTLPHITKKITKFMSDVHNIAKEEYCKNYSSLLKILSRIIDAFYIYIKTNTAKKKTSFRYF